MDDWQGIENSLSMQWTIAVDNTTERSTGDYDGRLAIVVLTGESGISYSCQSFIHSTTKDER